MRSFELHRMRKMDNSLDAFTIEISCCDMQSKCYTRYAVYIKVIPIKLENKKRVGLMFYNCRCQITHPFFHPRVRSVALPHCSSVPTELSSGPNSPHPSLNRGAASVRPTLPVRIVHCACRSPYPRSALTRILKQMEGDQWRRVGYLSFLARVLHLPRFVSSPSRIILNMALPTLYPHPTVRPFTLNGQQKRAS